MTFKAGDRVRIVHDRFPPVRGPSRVGKRGIVRVVRQHQWGWLNIDVEVDGKAYWFDMAELEAANGGKP